MVGRPLPAVPLLLALPLVVLLSPCAGVGGLAAPTGGSNDGLLYRMPDQVELMRAALENALDSDAAAVARADALGALQELVEDMDNAGDFKTIDGFRQLHGLLAEDSAALQAGAAWVLGTGAQNNRELQLHMLELGALPSLVRMLRTQADASTRAKALYAISSLVRNCAEGWAAFEGAGGTDALLVALADAGSARIVRKALTLLTDLLTDEAAATAHALSGAALTNSTRLCDAVGRCFRAGDADAEEKAVLALDAMDRAGLALTHAAGCDVDTLRDELRQFVTRCEAAESAEDDAESDAGCGDALDSARELEARLAPPDEDAGGASEL